MIAPIRNFACPEDIPVRSFGKFMVRADFDSFDTTMISDVPQKMGKSPADAGTRPEDFL
jgi:hypothetical protein